MKFSLLLILLILCPAFGGQQSQDNLSGEQYEAFLIKFLTPLQNDIQPAYEDGTEMVWRHTQDGVITQPDQTYKLKHVKGYITPKEQRWYRQPSLMGNRFTNDGAKSTPAEVTISGRKIKSVRYEWVSRTTTWSYPPEIGHELDNYVLTQYILGTESPVLLREQTGADPTNWWAVTGIVEKQIGDRKYLCAEVKYRINMSGGYCLTTYYASPEITGHILEAINEFHLDPKANAGLERFETVQKIITIRPPTKN